MGRHPPPREIHIPASAPPSGALKWQGLITGKKASSLQLGRPAQEREQLHTESQVLPHDPQSAGNHIQLPSILVGSPCHGLTPASIHVSMGCSQSSSYYFGIINVSLDHLDIFSFALGVCFASDRLHRRRERRSGFVVLLKNWQIYQS